MDDSSRASALPQVADSALGEAWIAAREPQHYTIQVIALRDQDKLRDFIETHDAWSPWAVYEQSLKGSPLWVLVQGDYSDVAQAREAVLKFPADVQQRDQLWIRRFVMVQKELL